MIEIPILHGKKIEDFGRRELAESYCQVVRSIFFEEPLWNGTPEFTRVFPFGFLLYSSANPEMIMFMGQDGIWDFLDTITRKKFFVFSVRPEAGGKAITRDQNETLLAVAHAFGLGDIVLNPQLVICDFHFAHKKGHEDWEHIYDAYVGKFHVLELPNKKSSEYLDFFRSRLGIGMAGLDANASSASPATEIAHAIRNAEAMHLLTKSGEGLLKSLLKDFAEALPLFKWRPGKLGRDG